MKAQAVFGLILLFVLVVAVVGFIYYIEKVTENKEPLIGGCAEVSLDRLQECCDNWARENGVFVIACVGEWEIKDKECAWKCEEG